MLLTKEQRRKLERANFRKANGGDSCADCACREVLDAGPNRGRCLCHMHFHFFENTQRDNAYVCDKFERGTKMDGLIAGLANLLIESKQETDQHKQTLEAERTKLLEKLNNQIGLIRFFRERSIKNRIAEIDRELEKLKN